MNIINLTTITKTLKHKNVIVINWDGTFIDSIPATIKAFYKAAAKFPEIKQIKPIENDNILATGLISHHFRDYFGVPEPSELMNKVKAEFNKLKSESLSSDNLIAPAIDAVKQLRGQSKWVYLIVTGPSHLIEETTQKLGVRECFNGIYGCDSFPETWNQNPRCIAGENVKWNKSELVNLFMEKHSFHPQEICMLGSASDMQAANQNDINFVGIGWGAAGDFGRLPVIASPRDFKGLTTPPGKTFNPTTKTFD